jgi:Uma2 family endonuclease
MTVYAALGVPEVWRFDGEVLQFYSRSQSKYQPVTASPTLPQVCAADLLPFITLAETTDDTTLFRQFRAWVREHLVKD